MNRRSSKAHVRGVLVLVTATLGVSFSAHADQMQNTAVSGSYSQLLSDGYLFLDGNGVNVGVVEGDDSFANAYYGAGAANVTSPNSTLPNGNSDLPGTKVNFVQLPGGSLPLGANAGNFPANDGTNGVNYHIGNHATEVPGVIIGQGNAAAADTGIAPGAGIEFAALDNSNLGFGTPGQQNAALTIQSVLQQRNTPVVNMSWGFFTTKTTTVPTDGSSLVTRFVDWAAGNYDALMVVAGNEGSAGAPSDSYNSINVAATGARGYYSNGNFVLSGTGGILNYGIASSYNTSNITADGRIKTDIIAPGGDAGPGTSLTGTMAGLPAFGNQFQSTAGGQYEYTMTNKNGVDFYSQDSFTGGVTSQTNGYVADTAAPDVANPPPPTNPAVGLGGDDFVQSQTLAGTSFAAPVVSGASALLYQVYNTAPAALNLSADHRVMKAILLNGATHTYNGSALYEADGTTGWTRAAAVGDKPLPAGTDESQFPLGLGAQPGLDPQLGTGMLNVTNSLTNYLAGRQAPGLVNPVGWDLNTVAGGTAQSTFVHSYLIDVPVDGQFSATLCWDDPVDITDPGPESTYQAASTLTRDLMADLDLYLFNVNVIGNTATLGTCVDYSTSDVDNVEYLYDNLPGGFYEIEVANGGYMTPQDTTYGLAWSVPEPAGLVGLVPVILLLKRRRDAVS